MLTAVLTAVLVRSWNLQVLLVTYLDTAAVRAPSTESIAVLAA